MDRRGFLSLLGAGAAGLVLDPERLLWVPGQKTIFVPSGRVFIEDGPSVRLIRQWHALEHRYINRFDVLIGFPQQYIAVQFDGFEHADAALAILEAETGSRLVMPEEVRLQRVYETLVHG